MKLEQRLTRMIVPPFIVSHSSRISSACLIDNDGVLATGRMCQREELSATSGTDFTSPRSPKMRFGGGP